MKGYLAANRWPFPAPPTDRAFTTADVLSRTLPIAIVVHDRDGGWHFYPAGQVPPPLEEARVATLEQILKLDITMESVADLYRGWRASRHDVADVWRRIPMPEPPAPPEVQSEATSDPVVAEEAPSEPDAQEAPPEASTAEAEVPALAGDEVDPRSEPEVGLAVPAGSDADSLDVPPVGAFEATEHGRLESFPYPVPLLGGKKLSFTINALGESDIPELSEALDAFLKLGDPDRELAARYLFEYAADHDVSCTLENVWSYVHPSGVALSRRAADGLIYVALSGDCDWDKEHGVQLVYRAGSELCRVSGRANNADAWEDESGEIYFKG